MSSKAQTVTAAIVIIGNEILSGRVKDENISYLAEHLNEAGVQLRECRVVPDIEAEIVTAVNELRARFDYVFTTGGIGPTHDDITADSIGAAFGMAVEYNPQAMALLEEMASSRGVELNDARKRMARMPVGAEIVENPISRAPGFKVENVYVLAGVPMICQTQFQSLKHQLVGGAPVRSIAVKAHLSEGGMAAQLSAIQDLYPQVDIGSYPFYREGTYGTSIVCRSQDTVALNRAADDVRDLMRSLGATPVDEPV